MLPPLRVKFSAVPAEGPGEQEEDERPRLLALEKRTAMLLLSMLRGVHTSMLCVRTATSVMENLERCSFTDTELSDIAAALEGAAFLTG